MMGGCSRSWASSFGGHSSKGADMLVESLYEAVPLGLRIGVVVALGVGAIPLMFSREIKEWRSRKPPPDSLPELPEDKDLILDDREAVRCNPGNGWRVARLIMQCSTENEIDAAFADFFSAENRTSPVDAFAARALKKSRLLNRDHQDDQWWWDFYEEANRLGISDEDAISTLQRLEEEFPDKEGRDGAGENRRLKGIPDLQRCLEELIKYSGFPVTRKVTPELIKASNDLFVHLSRACAIFDEQGESHPKIEKGLTVTNHTEWIEFLSKRLAQVDAR